MHSKVKVLGHPIHPMLVAFPITFYTSTLVAFIVYAATRNPFWFQVGTLTNWAGVATALLAAVPGVIDWASGIPRNAPAKHTGFLHMMLNTTALALFVINGAIQLRQWGDPMPGARAGILLSALGVGFTLPAGFLGWKLVQHHHVGVDLTPAQQRLEPLPEAPAEGRPPPPLEPRFGR
jgi:uncharacterized membrane protein